MQTFQQIVQALQRYWGERGCALLQPYDIVEVDKAKKSIAQTVLEIVAGTGRAALGGFGNALPTRVLY